MDTGGCALVSDGWRTAENLGVGSGFRALHLKALEETHLYVFCKHIL